MLHVRMLRRAASGEYDLAPDQLFSTIEQLLFTQGAAIAEKEGKPVRLAVAAANDLLGRHSAHGGEPAIEHDRGGKLRQRRPWPSRHANRAGVGKDARAAAARTLELFTPSGQEQIFYLGPHAPRLTPKEIDLLHKLWLESSEQAAG